ncbi:MAG TPA: diguanylate cyclase, partial [Rhodocyclaceae bacterium]|nr:diguanylate cyclase [Rhodocyclaceae bacterium]
MAKDADRSALIKDLLLRAAEQHPLPIFITDREARIQYVNPAMEAAFGYTAAEMLGQTPRLFKSGQVAPDIYRNLWRTISEGLMWEGEMLNRRKDGQVQADRLRVVPLRDGTGNVTHYMAMHQDPSTAPGAPWQIEYLSTFDQLTGLPNRSYFMARLAEALRAAAAVEQDMSLVHLDLDRFKSFNDSLGPIAADQLLAAVADRLKSVVRRDDVLARIAGDEFVLVLWGLRLEPGQTDGLKRIVAAVA